MKFYVVDVEGSTYYLKYQPITEAVRVEGSGWDVEEWDNEDAEWQVKDDIASYLIDDLGLDDLDSKTISVVDMDATPSNATEIGLRPLV